MRYLALSLVIVALAACSNRAPYAPPSAYEVDWVPPGDRDVLDAASLAGDMLDVGPFDADAYTAYRTNYYGQDIVELHAGAAGGADFGWVMLRFGTDDPDGLDGATFASGATVTTGMQGVGCTGPSHGNYIYDGSPQDIEVQVEPGPDPDSRLFHVQAIFAEQGNVEASFVLAAR